MKIKLIIAVVAAGFMMGMTGDHADAQSQNSFSPYIWTVKRTATHVGSGGSYVQSYGPYYTYQAAVAKKAELDAVRFQGTFGYGLAYIESAPNPALRYSAEYYSMPPFLRDLFFGR